MRRRSIVEELEAVCSPLHLISRVKWESVLTSRDRYVAYCLETFGYIRASVPLMEFARHRASGSYEEYLARHMIEERNHDDWLAQDLASLGVRPTWVKRRQVSTAVERMVGAQYYAIAHIEPRALLGHMYALESAPPQRHFLLKKSKQIAVPATAMSTLLEHGKADRAHRDELINVIQEVGSSTVARSAIVESAYYSLVCLIEILSGLDAVHVPRHARNGV